MIKVDKIDVNYVQQGGVCVWASYSIIIDYYSNKFINHTQIFSRFIDHLRPEFDSLITNTLATGPVGQMERTKENLITDIYQKHCVNNGDIRGFDYITDLHNTNILGTKEYCVVKGNKAVKTGSIPQSEKMGLRDDLKNIGGLAMVLYPEYRDWHSIVVGYDSGKNNYFKRDPNKNKICNDDFLLKENICEYIWFSDK